MFDFSSTMLHACYLYDTKLKDDKNNILTLKNVLNHEVHVNQNTFHTLITFFIGIFKFISGQYESFHKEYCKAQ